MLVEPNIFIITLSGTLFLLVGIMLLTEVLDVEWGPRVRRLLLIPIIPLGVVFLAYIGLRVASAILLAIQQQQ